MRMPKIKVFKERWWYEPRWIALDGSSGKAFDSWDTAYAWAIRRHVERSYLQACSSMAQA